MKNTEKRGYFAVAPFTNKKNRPHNSAGAYAREYGNMMAGS